MKKNRKKPEPPLLLIDGYNLIYAIGLLPATPGRTRFAPGKLRDARDALLELLVRGLPEKVRERTTLIFDALEPPEFLPDSFRLQGMSVQFARNYRDADERIIEMIHSADRGTLMTVVSSDHRIQAAAQRRKMKAYDSDQWYFGGLPVLFPETPPHDLPSQAEKPEEISPEETRYWLDIFGESSDSG